MTMRLAQDETRIVVDNLSAIILRPTLRAAYRLERRFGSFESIYHGVVTGSVTLISAVIAESTDNPGQLPDILDSMSAEGLGAIINRLAPILIPHVMALAGIDDDEHRTKRKRAKAVKPISFEEHHRQLYRIATGWLGWTPATAWSATPAEITEAYAGHIEMLKAIHGVAEKPGKRQGSLADKFRSVFATRGTKKVAA